MGIWLLCVHIIVTSRAKHGILHPSSPPVNTLSSTNAEIHGHEEAEALLTERRTASSQREQHEDKKKTASFGPGGAAHVKVGCAEEVCAVF